MSQPISVASTKPPFSLRRATRCRGATRATPTRWHRCDERHDRAGRRTNLGRHLPDLRGPALSRPLSGAATCALHASVRSRFRGSVATSGAQASTALSRRNPAPARTRRHEDCTPRPNPGLPHCGPANPGMPQQVTPSVRQPPWLASLFRARLPQKLPASARPGPAAPHPP